MLGVSGSEWEGGLNGSVLRVITLDYANFWSGGGI